MATKSADAEAAPPPKSKKMLIIVVVAVVLVAALAGVFLVMKKNQHAADTEEEDDEEEVVAPAEAPAYLPMDNMVVNLADPGGERVAQIGITLEVASEKDVEQVKSYLPAIRSEILMLISQRTADELLTKEGKEKLSTDILAAASLHFGKKKGQKKGKGSSMPVRGVLFSSFIVQ